MEQFPSPAPSPTPAVQPQNIILPLEQPKILQSLLYGNYNLNYGYPSTKTFHQQLFDQNDPFRPRSGSLQSLGSTASSFRPDRPPSRDSNSSYESLTLRASPIITAEESSAASFQNDSKLFNILRGNITSPFNRLFESLGQPQFQSDQKETCLDFESTTHKQSFQNESNSNSKRHDFYSLPKRQMASNTEEGPIDLSYKSKKSKIDFVMPRRFTMPAEFSSKAAAMRARITARTSKKELVVETQQDFLEPVTSLSRLSSRGSVQLNQDFSENSILKSILNDNNKGQSNCYKSVDPLDFRTREVMSAPASPATHSFSEPASPCAGFTSSCSGPFSCDSNPKVTIAKKTLFPVRARVTDWIQKIVQFAKAFSIFSSLTEDDQLLLVSGAWARILLLYMAEYHFEFAVTPVSDSEISQLKDNSSQEIPTMKSVESIQSFVKKCQNLRLDSREYEYIKVALIFQSGINGVVNRKMIEDISAKSRQDLQEYERSKKPSEMMRYSNILLLLHTLSGINSAMVQNLFCGHIVSTGTMRDHIKNLLKEVEN